MNEMNSKDVARKAIVKRANYVAPSVKMKTVVIEDGFGTSQFSNHTGMTETMTVVSWN
jgi:C4-type Zn-finger protein